MQVAVDILILGAGWTSTFLIAFCKERALSYAATTRSGVGSTILFDFDADSEDPAPYKTLPDAKTILITFPINKLGASERLVRLYKSTRAGEAQASFIQLGATSIWGGGRHSTSKAEHQWYDRHSPFIETERSLAEDELLALNPSTRSTILNLAGLWGGSRSPVNWVDKVAPTKEALRSKGSIHLIHGSDIARAILAVHANFDKAAGQRWIITDERVYDWWDLASSLVSPPSASDSGVSHEVEMPLLRWTRELMREEDVKALPRNVERLGRALDSREFWETFDLSPINVRIVR